MNLDRDLKRALRRQAPDPGFAGRVLQRIETEERRSRLSGQAARVHSSRWWRAAAASVMLVVLGGGYAAHEYQQRREGEKAREQVLQALQIAGAKVRYAQEEVRAIGTQD
jgi:anti-sigma-K factor RskA